MEDLSARPVVTRGDRARDLIGLIVAWGLWAALSLALFFYIRDYSRNIPYCDEFGMVSVMTGAEPVSLRWAWSQHNEHRPMISRLIMAGLFRWIGNDFRVARYANAVLLSAMAASMLVLVRKLRGSSRMTDAVLPLSILNIGQAESLMIGFAMNLILTSLLALALLAAAGLAHRGRERILAMGFGLSLVLLPLCGGSGLAMLPPLAAWLAGYLAFGWWSGARPARPTRLIAEALILASIAIAALYLVGYTRPANHPLPPSKGAILSATTVYLSLAVYPNVIMYWAPAGRIVLALVAATLVLLTIAARRSPDQRPRALGLMAVILSMLCVAAVVGVSRSGLGPRTTLASRYITLTIPLLCAIYVSWLMYARGAARWVVHLALVGLMVMAFPPGRRFSRFYGDYVGGIERRVEQELKDHVPPAVLVDRACPVLLTDREATYHWFKLLKAARVGAFAEFEDVRTIATPKADTPLRR